MTSLLHFTPSNPILNFSNIQCRELSKPNNFKPPPSTSTTRIPARDRVIDFGKHKGKMMGTLSSTYLKWVSKNLRARDFEDWAKMADQVLEDPVYKDRLEWEFADKLLNGDELSTRSSDEKKPSAVQELLEISERFGWDNEDKLGWSKIDFQLLGTSNGGRIPRVRVSLDEREGMRLKMKREKKLGQSMGKEEDRERREERRERLKMKMKMKREVVVGKEMEMEMEMEKKKDMFGIRRIDRGNEVRIRFERNDEEDRTVGIIHNPFPGREALLKKVLDRKKVL